MKKIIVKKAINAKKVAVNALKERFTAVFNNGEKIANTLKAAKEAAVEASRVEAVLRALPDKDISATTMAELETLAQNDATIAAVVNMAKTMPVKGGDGLVRDDSVVRDIANFKTLEVLKKAITAIKKAVNTVCRNNEIEKIAEITEITDGNELLRAIISESGIVFPSKMTWEELTQPLEDIKSVRLRKIDETKVEVKKAVTTTDDNENENEDEDKKRPMGYIVPLVICRKEEKTSVTADSIIKKMEPVAEEYITAVSSFTAAMNELSIAITAAADIAAELNSNDNDDINDDGNDDDNNGGVDIDAEISGLIDNIDTAISLLPEMSESDNVTIKQIGEDRLTDIAKEVVEKLMKAGELHEETLQGFVDVDDEILNFCLRAVLKADVSGEETGEDVVIPDAGNIGAGNCYEDNNNNNNNDDDEPLDFNGVTPNELVATEGFKPLVVIREVMGKYITTTPYENGIMAIWERESANTWRRYFVKFAGALLHIATADEKAVADGIDKMLFVNNYAGESKENGLSEVFSELAVCEFMTGYQKPETKVATLDLSDPLVAAVAAVYPDEEIVIPGKYASASVVADYNAVIAERQAFLEEVAETTLTIIGGDETKAIEVWEKLTSKLLDGMASAVRVEDGEILVEDFDPFDNTTFGTTYRLTANGFELC